MRPTFSLLFFTVLSGAGYGVLFLVGLALVLGVEPSASLPTDAFSFASRAAMVFAEARLAMAAALLAGSALAGAGLLCSVGHLGRPLRAWRAFSQWRTSWLSREGVMSVLTFLPVAALLVLLWRDRDAAIGSFAVRIAAALLCVGAAATTVCTANIYASLKTIRAWHDRLVVPGYLGLGLYSGALCLTALAMIGAPSARWAMPLWIANAVILAPCAAALKLFYWRTIDAAPARPDTETATGLAHLGHVSSFEQPHTEQNYLTHEMGFVLARKHSARLRTIACVLILLSPIGALALAWLIGWPAAWLGLVFGLLGVLVERWLFFAEATHAVMAYYSRA